MNTMLLKSLSSEVVQTANGGVIQLRRRTLLDDKIYFQFIQRVNAPDYVETLAKELGYPAEVVDTELASFLYVSAQVVCVEGLDFEYAVYGDSGEAIAEKFTAYIQTQHDDVPLLTHAAINRLTVVNTNPVTAPGVATTDPKLATREKSGKTKSAISSSSVPKSGDTTTP